MKNSDLYFQDTYRISSNRLSWYNYASSWRYFITICTKYKKHFFGHIHNNTICLSHEWSICYQEISKTSSVRNNTLINSFVVMPNHVHLIIEILDSCNTPLHKTSTTSHTFWPQSKSIPTIIRWIKWAITSRIKKFNSWFSRQSRYHDHIIRNEKELHFITEYIENNIIHWEQDTFFKQ